MPIYRSLFQFKKQPAYEILYINIKRPKILIGLPGIISLDLANTFTTEEKHDRSLNNFIDKYSHVNWAYMKELLINEMISSEKLDYEKKELEDFIKMVFLPNSKQHPEFDELADEDRISSFMQLKDQNNRIANHFINMLIKPYFNFYNKETLLSDEETGGNNSIHKDTAELQVDSMTTKENLMLQRHLQDLKFTWDYESNNLIAISWLELLLMSKNGVKIKSCQKCTAYFSPYPPNTLHCPECRKQHTAQTLYRKRVKKYIDDLPKEERENLLKKEREERAKYMKEYRRKKNRLK